MPYTPFQSNTWPFATLHEDIPFGLFVDAHVASALSCSLTGVIVSGGNMWVSVRITGLDNAEFDASSETERFQPGAKLKFYNAVGKCCGWFLTGSVAVPDTIVQDVSYPLSDEACVPVAGYEASNTTGMTGDWTIEGRDGITVDSAWTNGHLSVAFGSDADWWTMEDPNAVEKEGNDGVWTINGLPGQVITIDCENALLFPDLNANHQMVGILVVPPLVFFHDRSDGSAKSRYVFQPQKESNGTWGGKWKESGGQGTVAYDNEDRVFSVKAGGITFPDIAINDTVVWENVSHQKFLNRLAVAWEGLGANDPFRKYLKTSAEDSSPYPYPLDPILTGSGVTTFYGGQS